MPYTYILRCSDGSYYTGWTIDLDARLKSHNSGRGSRYTRGRLPVTLVYWELHQNRGDALRRESAIRKLRRSQKESLINKTNGQTPG
jgi:putative endonuclease